MIILRASTELKMTFEKLIQTMKVPVKWNGLFVVVDNYIVLQGELRSFIFHFDSRKAADTLIDLEVDPAKALDVSGNVYIQNVINMILYVFGKWGTIKGLKVEKNYVQLNQLFSGIMKEIGVEPEYTQERFRFYKDGIRITYEDVIQAALEAKEKEPEPQEEKAQGLWHKLVWKRERLSMSVVETTLSERQKNRIGNNFYLTGYLCPACKEKMHMVVYPVGKEFQIETKEGNVILARAYACEGCCCYYTPYPKKLLVEGDAFVMDFEGDQVAYEDYQKLLGKDGDRVSNYNFNEFADKRAAEAKTGEDSKQEMEEMLLTLPELSSDDFEYFMAKIEEGFFPDRMVAKAEKQIKKEQKVRKEGTHTKRRNTKNAEDSGQMADRENRSEPDESINEKERQQAERRNRQQNVRESEKRYSNDAAGYADSEKNAENPSEYQEQTSMQLTKGEAEREAKRAAVREKYRTRVGQLSRLSERQRRELKSQLEQDVNLNIIEKNQLLEEITKTEQQENLQKMREKAKTCEKKPYAVIVRVYEEISGADIPSEEKTGLLDKLRELKKAQGEVEVKKLAEKLPQLKSRKEYQTYLAKIREYSEVDTSAYEKQLSDSLKTAETQEIAEMIKRARKTSREDLSDLLERLTEQNFLPELLAPYEEKIKSKIREMDQEAIAELCGNPMVMDFEEAEEAYHKIEEGPFLPELKSDALKMLRKRLAKIKTDECELLVQKLKGALEEVHLADVQKHYFYPARKVLMQQAAKEETEVIDFAKASYGAGIGEFEYPIMVADTSHNGSGEKGMLLTPEKLYYSNLLTSYHISVFSIESIKAMTGLLNKGLYVYQTNGNKIKLPYVVETSQLPKLAEVLDSFVKYLQEKPFSRKETYLVKEKHETICCFRCGFVYKGGATCPKCGYQKNE